MHVQGCRSWGEWWKQYSVQGSMVEGRTMLARRFAQRLPAHAFLEDGLTRRLSFCDASSFPFILSGLFVFSKMTPCC